MTGPAAAPLEYQLIGLTESRDVGDTLSALDQKQGRLRLQALIAEWPRRDPGNSRRERHRPDRQT